MDGPGRYCDNLLSESADTGQAMGSAPRIVLVWDIFIRVVHWLIVALVAAAYATWRLNWMVWHGWVGDAVLTLLLFRLSWGFFGGETARFSRFLASPRTVLQHLKHSLQREPDHQVGHNPAGGWMVLILLALLLVETLTGLYVANDIADQGPEPAAPDDHGNKGLARKHHRAAGRQSRASGPAFARLRRGHSLAGESLVSRVSSWEE